MKRIKNLMMSAVLATTLFAAIPAPKANAGLILLPTGVGVVILIIGVLRDRLGLIILDADQANVQSQIEQKLGEKYSFIDDAQALKDLAAVVTSKISLDQTQDQIEVKLSRQEILDILAPTGLAELENDKVEALIADFQ